MWRAGCHGLFWNPFKCKTSSLQSTSIVISWGKLTIQNKAVELILNFSNELSVLFKKHTLPLKETLEMLLSLSLKKKSFIPMESKATINTVVCDIHLSRNSVCLRCFSRLLIDWNLCGTEYTSIHLRKWR